MIVGGNCRVVEGIRKVSRFLKPQLCRTSRGVSPAKEVISRSLPCFEVSVGDILDCAFNTIGPRFRLSGVFGEFALFITWVEVVIAVIGHSELNRLNHRCNVHGVVRHSFK